MTPLRLAAAPALALALVLSLSACNDAKTGADATPAGKSGEKASVAAIAAEAKGFTVGSEMNVRRVFVFFDAQCPHCGELWEAAKPLKGQARFIWIPVGVLNKASTSQGAAILAAPDPAAAMEAHEQSMRARQGGITAAGDVDAQAKLVASNTALMNRFGFGSIPTIVANNATTGELVVKEGSLPTAALAAALGLQAPAGQ